MARLSAPYCVLALALVLVLVSKSADAGKKPRVKYHPDASKHPSSVYAAMSADHCIAELGRRRVAFTRLDKAAAPGVLAPIRLPKDVGGVTYRTAVTPSSREQNPHEVFDCRLVLSLSDFSKILAAHDIDEVLIFSAWRPPSKRWPDGQLAMRHPGGLAIDAYRFGKRLMPGQAPKAKVWLDVAKDFGGKIGARLCGSLAAAPPPTLEGKELRSIVCESADAHLFTSILTPHYNRAHFNHLHLEVTPGVSWYLLA